MSSQSKYAEKLCDLPLRDREEISSLIARLQQAQQDVLQRGFTSALVTLHSMSDVRSVQLEGERDETPEEAEKRLALERDNQRLNQESNWGSLVAHLQYLQLDGFSREMVLAAWEEVQKGSGT